MHIVAVADHLQAGDPDPVVIAPAEGALVQQQMAEGTRPAEIDARAALQRGIAADQHGPVKIVDAGRGHAHGPGPVERLL